MGENLEWLIFVQKFWVILVVLLLGFVQSLEFLKKSWNLQSKWKIWNLQSKWKIEVRSGKMVKVWSFSFSKLQQVLTREYFSYSQIPFNLICSKGIYYNHRMTSFRTLSCPHCTVVTVCLQCIHEKKLCSCVFQGLNWSLSLNFGSKYLYEPCTLILSKIKSTILLFDCHAA